MVQNVLDKRSSEILKCVVDFYLETGEPIGSRSISERYDVCLSPATIRNVMSDLEEAGFLFSTHTSSGRAPTSLGINIFINELKEKEVSLRLREEKHNDFGKLRAEAAVEDLSNATNSLGLLVVDKREVYIEYMEIRKISMDRCVFTVALSNGVVKNNVFSISKSITEYDVELANFLLNKIYKMGRADFDKQLVFAEIDNFGPINKDVVSVLEKALLSDFLEEDYFVIKGQTNLFDDVRSLEQFNMAKKVVDMVQRKELFEPILESVKKTESSQVINCEDMGVSDSCGCSFAVSPCFIKGKVIGVVGIVGYMKRNYKKVVPAVEFTAKIISEII